MESKEQGRIGQTVSLAFFSTKAKVPVAIHTAAINGAGGAEVCTTMAE